MKEKMLNNLGLKILSILLAFSVWFMVVNISNPEVTRSKDVTLEIENAQVLTDARRAYEISGKSVVTISYDVRTKDEYQVRSSDFRAYVDLAELYDVTGSVQVQVEVLNNKDLIQNVKAKPGVIQVKTEEIQTKRFELAVSTSGTTASEYALSNIALSPEYITVEGPISKVGQISHVGIEINVDGLDQDTSGTAKPVFYDANGNSLEISNRIKVNVPEIQYELSVSKVKHLPLDFNVMGTVADGYQYTGIECEVKSISVVGHKTDLATIDKITIPQTELNLDGITGDKQVTVDVRNYLPEDVMLVENEDPYVTILLKVEQLSRKNITLSEDDITKKNHVPGFRYRLLPSRIEVVVEGLAEDLEGLRGEDLQASIDLGDMETGIYAGVLEFERNAAFHVVDHAEFEVEIVPIGETEEDPESDPLINKEPTAMQGSLETEEVAGEAD